MSALYDGLVEEEHLDGGWTFRLTLKYRIDGKDYRAHREWRHNHRHEVNTRPPLHNRDSMKWNCADDIDREVASDRRERHEREERTRFNEGTPS